MLLDEPPPGGENFQSPAKKFKMVDVMEMVACIVCTLLIVTDCVTCPCCGTRQPRKKKSIDLTGTTSPTNLTRNQKSKRKRKRTYSAKNKGKKKNDHSQRNANQYVLFNRLLSQI